MLVHIFLLEQQEISSYKHWLQHMPLGLCSALTVSYWLNLQKWLHSNNNHANIFYSSPVDPSLYPVHVCGCRSPSVPQRIMCWWCGCWSNTSTPSPTAWSPSRSPPLPPLTPTPALWRSSRGEQLHTARGRAALFFFPLLPLAYLKPSLRTMPNAVWCLVLLWIGHVHFQSGGPAVCSAEAVRLPAALLWALAFGCLLQSGLSSLFFMLPKLSVYDVFIFKAQEKWLKQPLCEA